MADGAAHCFGSRKNYACARGGVEGTIKPGQCPAPGSRDYLQDAMRVASEVGSLVIAHSNQWRHLMGDKSPKAKERQQKQDTTHKNDDKAAALAKAKHTPVPGKKPGK